MARTIIFGILVAIVVVFVVQNIEVVEVRLLTWKVSMSRALMLLGTLVIGIVAGWLLRRPAAQAEVAKVAGRATLAIIVSIVVLVLAIVAFTRTLERTDLDSRLGELQKRVETLKQETLEKVDRVREETSRALENLGQAIEKKEGEQ